MIALDTIRFAVPLNGWRAGATEPERDRLGRLRLGRGATAWIKAPSGLGSAFVEFSVPRVLTGSNVIPSSVSAMPSAVIKVVGILDRYVEVLDPTDLATMRVRRLDAVRDFAGVRHLDVLLASLARIPRPSRLHTQLHRHAGAWETVTVGVRSWSASLYDKHAESGGVAAFGHLRCELRLWAERLSQPWARNHGGVIRVLGDVEESKLESLGMATFEQVGFDSAVSAPTTVLELVLSITSLQPQERATLLFVVLSDAAGEQTHLDPKTVRRFRKLAAQFGIHAAATPSGPTLSLDWATGTELVAP